MSNIAIFVDFGSTYTKAVAIDIDEERIIGHGLSASTVTSDVSIGLKAALQQLESNVQQRCTEEATIRLACSSAAGGLRLAVVGLVPNLSLKAGRMAALGAGAKLVGNYSYKLNQSEIDRMQQASPDIIFLVGGTDGGNEEVIIHNAKMIAGSNTKASVVVAGNKVCADDITCILESSNKYVKVVENVLGSLDELNVEPSRAAIREIFMNRIVHAKGLDKAGELLDGVIMPTPMAVLKAAEVLAMGSGGEAGLGELVIVDVGGATTDIHSIAHGRQKDHGILMKGIAEPFAKRTVEGDLGLRYNAMSIVETTGEARILRNGVRPESVAHLRDRAKYLSEHVETLPTREDDFQLDNWLARMASETAMERHAGRLEQIYSPQGPMYIQTGKDLRDVGKIIGTGGIFAHSQEPSNILEGVLFSNEDPLSLRPQSPEFFVDKRYILYAIGLLAERAPEKAVRIGKRYLEQVSLKLGGEK